MEIYLVGGAVRDELLGYPIHERDYVVVGSTPEAMVAKGFTPVGSDFPVFLHPKTKEEYALARTERKSARGYKGFTFNAAPTITLEEDLVRRDLTINAIAKSEDGEINDPYGGRRDIEAKRLRHVSLAFREDPVRILRVARFAARYHHLGFQVADETLVLMKEMVANNEVDYLVAERVWKESSRALDEQNPEIFLKVLKQCGALSRVMPQVDELLNASAKTSSFEFSQLVEIKALHFAAKKNADTAVRFATLLHTQGISKRDLDVLVSKLKIPNEVSELASLMLLLVEKINGALESSADDLFDLLHKGDALRRTDRFIALVRACEICAQSRDQDFPQRDYLLTALEKIQQVSPSDLLAEGLSGKALGDALKQKRIQALEALRLASSEVDSH